MELQEIQQNYNYFERNPCNLSELCYRLYGILANTTNFHAIERISKKYKAIQRIQLNLKISNQIKFNWREFKRI